MKILAKDFPKKLRYLILTILFGFLTALFAEPALAQLNGKNRKNDKIGQAILKEAKVLARVVTTVEEISPMRVRLNVLNPTGKQVRISILNRANMLVFREYFTGKEYNTILNLTSTPTGQYSLNIIGKKQAETRRFTITRNWSRDLKEITKENPNSTDVMAAIYKASPTQIVLHLANNTGQPVDYIFRNQKQEVFSKGRIRDSRFSKMFEMNTLNDGKYTMEVKYGTEMAASKTFDIKTVYNRSFAWTDKRYRPLKPAGGSPMAQKTF